MNTKSDSLKRTRQSDKVVKIKHKLLKKKLKFLLGNK